MKEKELRDWWIVEWYPGAGFHCLPVGDVVERNVRQCMENVEKGYMTLGLLPDLEAGREYIRQLKRKKIEAAEAAKGENSDTKIL